MQVRRHYRSLDARKVYPTRRSPRCAYNVSSAIGRWTP